MRHHGPWKIVSSREVHRDPWVVLQVDDVIRPDGNPGTFTVAHMKRGVSILALDDAGLVYLTREFRYALGRESLEVVSGGIDEGEEPLAAAQRELKEELGIEASRWTDLGTNDPFTSMVHAPVRLFLARSLIFGECKREGTEKIRCVKMTLADAVHHVLENRISNATSSVLILKAHLRLQLDLKS